MRADGNVFTHRLAREGLDNLEGPDHARPRDIAGFERENVLSGQPDRA